MTDNLVIAPHGLIIGNLSGETADGAKLAPRQRHCIVLLDGWLHHMTQNVGDVGLNTRGEEVSDPWFRMHPRDVPGFARADVPAPLVQSDRIGAYGIHGYDALVVHDGLCKRYFYNHEIWSASVEAPIITKTIGAPVLLNEDETFSGYNSQMQAFTPGEEEIWKHSFVKRFNAWFPSFTYDNTIRKSWPSIVLFKNSYMMFVVIDGTLRVFMRFINIPTALLPPFFQNWFEASWLTPKIECSGPPAVVVTRPLLVWKGMVPVIEPGQIHVVVPTGRDRRLTHLVSSSDNIEWRYNTLDAKTSHGVSLVESPNWSRDNGRDVHSDVFMLFPDGRDMHQARYSAENASWSAPTFAF